VTKAEELKLKEVEAKLLQIFNEFKKKDNEGR
jgi:hypothetical protein